jgi:RNA ligase
MQFPVIEHIDQVREAIKDRPEFIEADRGNYTVFNYMVAHPDSFDCPIRRECRGLIFDHKGKVLSRRFHKFFNLGEKEETFPQNINWNQSHVLLDKLDGSMITPLVLNNGDEDDLRWATKMGVTDIGLMAEKFVSSRPHYAQFALECHFAGWTPIFEYVSPNNRIVLPYQEENLILLAMRHNIKGEYLIPSALRIEASAHNIPVVPTYNGFSIDDVKDKTDIEGVVVCFDNGHRIKVKCDWYCAIHRAKENLLFEKNILKLILEEKLDDILPHLMEDDRKRVEQYQEEVLASVEKTVQHVQEILTRCAVQSISRKDFALKHMQNAGKFVSSLVFHCWDNTDMEYNRKEVIKAYLKHTSSQSAVDAIRQHIGTKWHPMGEVE